MTTSGIWPMLGSRRCGHRGRAAGGVRMPTLWWLLWLRSKGGEGRILMTALTQMTLQKMPD